MQTRFSKTNGRVAYTSAFVSLLLFSWSNMPASGQSRLGVVTALQGAGTYRGKEPLRLGQPLDSTDSIELGDGAAAGLFIVSDPQRTGLMGFSGEIVVEVDANTKLTLLKEQRTGAPVILRVEWGRTRVFFDPGRFKEMVLLETPIGQMRVTGSIIWVSHSDRDGTVFASEDSNAEIRITADGTRLPISSGQKVVVKPAGMPQILALSPQDLASWQKTHQRLRLPLSRLAGARSSQVRSRWEQETGEVEIPEEPGLAKAEENIPGQEAVLQLLSGVTNTQNTRITTPTSTTAAQIVRGRTATR